MTDYDYEPVVWVSLASVSGLSLISLGQPGLRTDLDEQVYTGGLTAVQTMLGGEIGGDTERFVGGSHSNRTGRFLVKNETGELVGQFLLISPENRVVAPDLVEYYEELVTIFAEDTIQTEVYERTMREFRALGVNDVLDLFLDSIKKARKRKSIPMNKDTFFFAVGQVVIKSINDYEYSTTLVKISEFKGKYSDLYPKIRNDRSDLIAELSNDMLEFLVSEHPHALVTFPKVDSVKKDFLKHIRSEIDNLQKQNKVEEGLKEIIEDFKENDLQEVLADFALNEVTKANLHARLEDEIFKKFRREFPLLFLIDPTIDGFENAIEDLTSKINEEYDVAGTLSRIGVDMLKGYKTEENLVIPYIRNFCEQFAAGLTLTAWKYMQILFRMVTMETKIDVTDVLPALQGQIPDTHFSTVQKMITKYKITKLDPLSFQVKKATDILPFYRALFSSLGFGINVLICQVALGEDNPGNYLHHTTKILVDFSSQIHYVFALFSIFSYLERAQSRLDFNIAFPEPEAFKDKVNGTTMNVQSIIAAFIEANTSQIQKEHQLVERRLDEFKDAFDNLIKDIQKYLSRNPIDISKGYSPKLEEVKILSFSTKPVRSVDETLQKTQEEYKKLIEKIQSDLDKAKHAALEFVDGKIAEKRFKKVVEDQGFLNKLQDNFQKLLQKTEDSLNKTYSGIPSSIEKSFNKFEKDFNKECQQACPFLNIDSKALLRGDERFLQDPSSKINKIHSSVNQIITKEELINWENLGAYYFSSKNRTLPTNLQLDISNSLVHKKSYPFLKEAIEVLKSNPNQDIYRSYTVVLENYTKEVITRIFEETGRIIDRDYIKTDLDIFFIERDKKPIPTIEMGILSSANAMNSLRGILGSRIAVESEERDETTFFHVSCVIPDLECDYGKLKKVWKKKEWTLRKVLLLLSWHSLLNTNSFYMNLLSYSSGFYSIRVKESLEEILQEIEKAIVST